MYTPEGVSSVANFITAYEESQENHFLICSVIFCFQRQYFLRLFSTLQLVLVPCAAVERLPVLHLSADYISFVWIIGPIGVYLKMEFCSCIL